MHYIAGVENGAVKGIYVNKSGWKTVIRFLKMRKNDELKKDSS